MRHRREDHQSEMSGWLVFPVSYAVSSLRISLGILPRSLFLGKNHTVLAVSFDRGAYRSPLVTYGHLGGRLDLLS